MYQYCSDNGDDEEDDKDNDALQVSLSFCIDEAKLLTDNSELRRCRTEAIPGEEKQKGRQRFSQRTDRRPH